MKRGSWNFDLSQNLKKRLIIKLKNFNELMCFKNRRGDIYIFIVLYYFNEVKIINVLYLLMNYAKVILMVPFHWNRSMT